MKNLLQTITFSIVAFLLFASSSYAQENFEGKIVYTISYKDLPAEMQAYEAMLPKGMTILMKGSKSRVEQKQMMNTTVIVSDMDNKSGFIEMEMGGQKMRMNVSTEEFDAEADRLENIEYLSETKTIAGYPCKKAVIKDDDGNLAMTIYYTEKIKNQAQREFVGLKGFPLEYSMSQNNVNMVMTASEVTKQNVADNLFIKSEGFKDISKADLQKMMGGGM